MKTLKSFLVAITLPALIMSCASTPKFEVKDGEDFDTSRLIGNWVCEVEHSVDIAKNKTMNMSGVWQERLDKNGKSVAVGTITVDIEGEGDTDGSFIYIEETDWIANKSKFVTKISDASASVYPNEPSSLFVTFMVSKVNKEAAGKIERANFELTDDVWIRNSEKHKDLSSTCVRWEAYELECQNDPSFDCPPKLEMDYKNQAKRLQVQASI